MVENIIGATLATVAGFGVAFLNFSVSKNILRKCPEKYPSATAVRLGIQILFLIAAFLFAEKTPAESVYVLIGAVLGVTLPSFYFTGKLLKLNAQTNNKKETEGEDADG